jgi:hypothetical protein
MHRHEMQQSNIYLGIYIIEYYFFWKNQGVTEHRRPQEQSLSDYAHQDLSTVIKKPPLGMIWL